MRTHATGGEAANDRTIGLQPKALVAENLLHRDDLAFHTGDFGNRGHPTRAILKTAGLNDQVHSRRNLGADRLKRHLDTCHRNHVFQTRAGITCRVRVDCRHRSVMARVHGLQHVDHFLTTGFTHDDAVRTHPQRVAQTVALGHFAFAFHIRGAAFHPADMHLLELTADRLWLVKDGTVKPYEDDLDAYRRMLLAGDTAPAKPKPDAAKPKRASRERLQELRTELRKCEARVEAITEMREKLSSKLADPALYDDAKAADLEHWQKKFAEIEDGLARAETLWMAALERLEEAEAR